MIFPRAAGRKAGLLLFFGKSLVCKDFVNPPKYPESQTGKQGVFFHEKGFFTCLPLFYFQTYRASPFFCTVILLSLLRNNSHFALVEFPSSNAQMPCGQGFQGLLRCST